MGEQEKLSDNEETVMRVARTATALLGLLIFGGFIGGFLWLMVSIDSVLDAPVRHPDYLVSITGVDGLNLKPTSGGGGVPTTLSPVFNLTVRIIGSNSSWESACVWGLSTAAVSYGDAFLARGSVPPFCAEKDEVQERVATAWGQDVLLPRFLRERLSAELERGEASLDVQVTMPAGRFDSEDRVLVCSNVKIGGSSPSPCRVEEVSPRPQPTPAAVGSTS